MNNKEKTYKVYLRQIKKKDINNGWLDWINDSAALDNLFATYPINEKDLINYFKLQKLPHSIMFAICLKENNKYIGNARLGNIDWVNKCSTYGRLIGDKKYKGKGLGSEALILLLRYGFQTLGLNRIASSALATNKISIKSNLKIGMVKEGILKEASFKNGKFVDRIQLSMIAKNFFKRYGK